MQHLRIAAFACDSRPVGMSVNIVGRLATLWIIVVAPLASCSASQHGSSLAGDQRNAEGTVVTFAAGNGHTFEGRIDLPESGRHNGWGVLMIGGGLGNDLDWTVPGSLQIDGKDVRFTINGETHADGPLISRALVDRGFAVMRWSTIRVNDPLKDRWPIEATPYPLATMTDHARSALDALRAQNVCKSDHIILLGHSLGSARACTIAAGDSSINGLILLAPAMLTREATKPSSDPRKHSMQWGEDVLKQRDIPALVICGELDQAQGAHGPAMARIARVNQLRNVDVRIMPGLGHQLGRMQDGRFGPIDDDVLQQIAEWAAQVAAK